MSEPKLATAADNGWDAPVDPAELAADHVHLQNALSDLAEAQTHVATLESLLRAARGWVIGNDPAMAARIDAALGEKP
jgi:hypothetical protein